MKGFLGDGPAAPEPFDPDTSLAHPFIELFAKSTFQELIPLLLLACVFAPIMEEIMFRGVLYRHLREATRSLAYFSIIISAIIVNVLFAAVHPQGLLAIPLLASLACGFILAREWRGSLVPAIIAHGLNNALVLTLLLGLIR